jgi:hypothetical protein
VLTALKTALDVSLYSSAIPFLFSPAQGIRQVRQPLKDKRFKRKSFSSC